MLKLDGDAIFFNKVVIQGKVRILVQQNITHKQKGCCGFVSPNTSDINYGLCTRSIGNSQLLYATVRHETN
jgi:hypothetical protein